MRGLGSNTDRATYQLAQRVEAGEFDWLDKGML